MIQTHKTSVWSNSQVKTSYGFEGSKLCLQLKTNKLIKRNGINFKNNLGKTFNIPKKFKKNL